MKGKVAIARAKTVGFAIPEVMLPDLQIVINEFSGENRSDFLADDLPYLGGLGALDTQAARWL